MSTAPAKTSDGKSWSPSAAGWHNLPDDLLGMVRSRISCPRDRVRLAAVCRPWHDASSRLPAQPAVPALILSPLGRSRTKHLCGPDGSWLLRVPSKAAGKRLVGSHSGGWIAATDNVELVIVNLFSGAEVTLSAKQSMIGWITKIGYENGIRKIIFSQDPASSRGCTIAALTDNHEIALCKVGCPDSGWSVYNLWRGDLIWDIAFYDGQLFGVTMVPEILVKFEIGMKEDGTPEVAATHPLSIQQRLYGCYSPTEYDAYIMELRGELVIVVRDRWLSNHKPFFRVFKLVDVDNNKAHKHKWEEMTNFGDYALFLGWSKAVHVPVDGRHGLKKNHIYYYRPTMERELPEDKVYSVTTGDGDQVYCREDRIGDGVGRTGYYLIRCYNSHMWRVRCNSVMWLYPPDF